MQDNTEYIVGCRKIGKPVKDKVRLHELQESEMMIRWRRPERRGEEEDNTPLIPKCRETAAKVPTLSNLGSSVCHVW